MRTKPLFLIALAVSVVFFFSAADMVIAADSDDGYWNLDELYNRPDPLMDYVPQESGIYDTMYWDLGEEDCQACHGNTAVRHQGTSVPCEDCHDGDPAPTDPPPYTCVTPVCHSWHSQDLQNNGWHHLTDASGSGNCVACHDPTLIGAFGPGTSLLDDPPTVILPTPYSCENCHWQQQVINQSGNPGNPGHPSTYHHYDRWGTFVGFYEYPMPILHTKTSHMKDSMSNITGPSKCGICHSLTGTGPENPGEYNWDPTNPELIRYCQRCHTKETLHTIHQQSFNAWKAVGYHTSGDPNGVPGIYRISFTASEMCDGCHAPLTISHISPRQQEPTVPYPYMASWLSAQLGYTVTNPRWGKVGIYGKFGSSQLLGVQVRIGDPFSPYDILNYDTEADPFTVEDINDGIGLKIGLWRNDLVGVYLFPAVGEIVPALYGPGNPGLGTMWLNKWLGLWVVKDNGGAPVPSNVKPVKVLAPLPD